MLRIILLIVISYIIIRIALRLLLTESPTQRRARGRGRLEDIEDAEFEEIPPRKPDEAPYDKK